MATTTYSHTAGSSNDESPSISVIAEKQRAAESRIRKVEDHLEKQEGLLQETRDIVISIKSKIESTPPHACDKTDRILHIEKQYDGDREWRRRIWVMLIGLGVGLLMSLFGAVWWTSAQAAQVKIEVERRETGDKLINDQIATLATKNEIETRLPTTADLEKIRSLVNRAEKAGDDGAWYRTMTPRERERFCSGLSSTTKQSLPESVRSACLRGD